MKRIKLGAALALAALAAGCRDKTADAIASNRPAAEARLALLERIGAEVKAAPKAMGSQAAPHDPPLRFGDNAGLAPLEAFADLAREDGWGRLVSVTGPPFWATGAALIRTGKLPGGAAVKGGPSFVHAELGRLTGTRYLGVVRDAVAIAPEVAGADAFTPGQYVGELHLFDLGEDGRKLGVVMFAATSSAIAPVEDREAWLREDLSVQARIALHDALVAIVPGSTIDRPAPLAE